MKHRRYTLSEPGETRSLAFDGQSYAAECFSLGAGTEDALRELRGLVGETLVNKILESDPQPMILKATDILDEVGPVNGQRVWEWGYWKFQVTESVLMSKLAPAMRGAPGYRGHLASSEHRDASLRTLWFGLDRQTNKLSAIVYILPGDASLRAGIRNAAAFGNLEREYRLSLAPRTLTFDKKDSNQIIDFGDAQEKKEISLDLVRFTGTKGARMKSPMMLSAEQSKNRATGSGGKKMARYEFDTLKELVADADVQEYLNGQVQQRLGALSAEQQMKVLAGVPVETLLAHEAVKPYASRPTRDDVLKSLTADELKAALSANEDLLGAATEAVAENQAKREEIQKSSLKIFADLGLPEADGASLYLLMGSQIVAAKDPAAEAKRIGELRLSSLGGKPGGADLKGKQGGSAAPAEAIDAGDSAGLLAKGRERLKSARGW